MNMRNGRAILASFILLWVCSFSTPQLMSQENGASLAPLGAVGDVHEPGQCLSQHMAEALAINRARQPLYARLSQGASVGVSEWLILSETIALPLARVMERWARPLVRAGLDIFCDVVVSMAQTPAFPSQIIKPAGLEVQKGKGSWSGIGTWAQLMWHALWGQDDRLMEGLEKQLEHRASAHSFYCMERHLLESVARAVTLAPEHREKSRDLGHRFLGSFLVRVNIVNQVMLIPFGLWLDQRAFQVQKEGIPIICNDVPPIPRG